MTRNNDLVVALSVKLCHNKGCKLIDLKGGRNMAEQQELLTVATAMLDKAYTPYSHFHVGAAALGASGKIYGGCNIENASFGATNCAERTAIFSGIAAGETHFTALLVTGNTDGPIAPCGICRQVIAEFFDADAPIYLTNQKGAFTATTVAAILPGAFTDLN
ncbi:cytidine deaminase [Levilactobacillus brevis]|uniref:cytidine deaminase n=1 Tax=Levilactobacillus brevis TaxID=1580 RepID=UPI0009B91218|nr:cytidine deaminase [Levilactobacillus brevis]